MRTIIIIGMLAAMGLAGCTAPEGGTASIYVKDAPTDEFDEIHVVFTKVEVHRGGEDDGDPEGPEDAEGADGAEGAEDRGGEWITVYENATGQDIDLLNASGNRAAFLGEAELETGNYQQIRIYATEAYGIKDGERIDFELAPTPLKLVRAFEVEADQETRIILDFDLDRSIVQMGPNGYRMTPVIGTTTAEIVEDDESGAEVHEEGEITEVA